MSSERRINVEEQKLLQLEMLKEIKNICDNNNLTYFLGGGTLLGAIRHNGYIPWDDDIDVMMFREDYNTLLNIFNQKCKSDYKLLSHLNTNDYYYPYAKIVNTKTKLLENDFREIKDMGVFVDVFPIDYLPDNTRKITHIFKKYKFLNIWLSAYQTDNIEKVTKSKLKLIFKKIFLPIIEKNRSYIKIITKMNNLAKDYNKTNTVACISGKYLEKEIMPSSYIASYQLADFEGEKYKVPVGYDSYLTKHYGDYLKLPPEDKQKSIHNSIAYWK